VSRDARGLQALAFCARPTEAGARWRGGGPAVGGRGGGEQGRWRCERHAGPGSLCKCSHSWRPVRDRFPLALALALWSAPPPPLSLARVSFPSLSRLLLSRCRAARAGRTGCAQIEQRRFRANRALALLADRWWRIAPPGYKAACASAFAVTLTLAVSAGLYIESNNSVRDWAAGQASLKTTDHHAPAAYTRS
jgi:hypothetical protein